MERNILKSKLQRTMLSIGLVTMLMGGLGCSSSDYDSIDDILNSDVVDSDEVIDEALVREMANTEPVFTFKDFEAVNQNLEETTNGTWRITKCDGVIRVITFYTQGVDSTPLPEAPKTIEEFFSEFLPLTADNQMVFLDKDYRNDPHYVQRYKGIPVEQSHWQFCLSYGVIQSAWGTFIPIDQLDVHPAVNLATAKKIMENFIHDSVEGDDKCIYLSIMSFPENGKYKPRLVYVYKCELWDGGDLVYVDAQTGRPLYRISYIGGAPY